MPSFSDFTPKSSLTSWIPGTPIELPHVDKNPVSATVRVTFHFLLLGQFLGFATESLNDCRASAAVRADKEVVVGLICGKGTETDCRLGTEGEAKRDGRVVDILRVLDGARRL